MDVRKKSAATLAALLAERAIEHPDRVALRFLGDGETVTDTLTYGELDAQARRLAAHLIAQGGAGERALLLYPTGPQYIVAFLACLYARVIAVPAYPPETVATQQLDRVLRIIGDARPRFLLTQADMLTPLETLRRGYPALGDIQVVASDAIALEGAPFEPGEISEDDLAFLQYTSGSTSQPKGVQVTHGNLFANEVVIRESFGIGDADTVVSWLPFNHDMGFIGGLLQPLFSGISAVLLSPRHFLERPIRWLNAISRFGGTVSGGPDFAYRLCAERVPEEALASLKLDTWRVAFSGSEPVRLDTLKNFSERFARCGFDASSLYACYGLAEATLFVTGGVRGGGIVHGRFDAHALARNEAVEQPDGGSLVSSLVSSPGSSALVSSGSARRSHEVRIVDPATGEGVEDGHIGEIWATGPSIAHGYWNNESATQSAFVARDTATWLRTGDMGFLKRGELYVTGRLKDMMIVRGQNLYPQDIESTVEARVELVRKGRVVAFPVDIDGQETIGVAAEVSRNVQKLVAADGLIREIRAVVAQAHQEPPGVVLLLNPGAVPKTTSGKLQRAACARLWENGQLDCYASFVNATQTPAMSGPDAAAADDQANSGIVRLVAEIWSEVLGVGSVQPDDSFFALGGSSLSAARIAARIQDRTGRTPELKAFFETPTLRAFADALAADGVGHARIESIRARDEGDERDVAPLSAGQQRMLFLWQLDPESAAYNVSGSLRIEGVLELDALQKVFVALKERHAALRTTLVEDGRGVVQKISNDASFTLTLDTPGDTAAPNPVEAAVRAETAAPFDLLGGALWRAKLIRETPTCHTLVVTLHHIISDAWSMNVLIDEFATLYRAFASGAAPALPPLAIDYADYSAWVRQHLEDGEEARQLAYWRDQLGDEHPVLRLPADRPQATSRTFEGASVSVMLPDHVSTRVRDFASAHHTTLFAVLLSAYSVLLSRLSGTADLRVGVPVANRSRTEAEGIVGFFVNTLVMRSQVAPAKSFQALTATVQRTALEAQSHQDVPFDRLVEVLQPDRLAGVNPLFQVMFNHLQQDFRALSNLPGLRVQASMQDAAIAKFDLGLNTAETPDGAVSASFVYSNDLFDRSTVSRIADDFIEVLDTVMRYPDRPLGALEFSRLSGQQALAAWSGVQAPPGAAGSVHLAFERQVAATPDAIALRHGAHVMTYAQLDARADRIAAVLQRAGVAPDMPVGVAIERSFDLVASLIGILKAGAAYLPLDPDYPHERLAYMMADAGLSMVLTHGDIAERLSPPEHVQLLRIDALPAQDERVVPAPVTLHPANLAYVLYTSGTTGRPKGVANTHGAMYARLAWMQSEYGLSASDTLLHKTPMGFDVAVWEIFWPLIVGAQVVIAEPGDHRDPRRLARLIREHGVSAIHFVPSMLRLFVEDEEAKNCTGLRYLFSGGEALSADLQAKVLGAFPAVRFDNRYGPTEALINATYWTCRDEGRSLVPIGRPIPGSQIHILDAGMNPVPVGVEGDLYIGGDILARGYAGRPALTAERFLPNPFDGWPASRLYRSGDRARWRPDGVVEYLGRDDHQVKIRGFRIELGEIEQALAGLPEVRASVVIARSGPDGSTRLVAYIVPVGSVDLMQARDRLAAQLPEHMVPAKLVALERMPLTPNGKLDRAALPDVQWDADGVAAPVTRVEVAVAQVWEDILQVTGIGLTDRFFDLGGHSLLATQVVARLRKAFDIDLPLRVVFEAQDLAAFAAHVQREIDEGRRGSQPALGKVDRSKPLPLSNSQERMWFLWNLEPESAVYNVGGAVRLTGPLDLAALDFGLQTLVARHEAFRTRFPTLAGRPVQQIAPTADIRIEPTDISALPEAAREASLHELAHGEAHRPFDLEHGPLIRLKLLKLGEEAHVLLVTIHHIIAEGWAMEVFAREYVELYRSYVDGREAALEPIDIQYADFAAWQHAWLSGGEERRQIAYWRERLGSDHPVLELPADRPRPAVQTFRGDYHRFSLDPALSARLREFCRTQGVTLFMTVTAALFVLLRRYAGQSDLRIGYPVANRIRPEFEGLIGAFLNTQVLRCEVTDGMSLASLLGAVRDAALDAQSNQDVPFHSIVEAVHPGRSAAYTPLFQVMCNVQRWDFQQTREIVPGLAFEFIPNDSKTAKFDLLLDVTDIDESLGCSWTYSTDLFDAETVEQMSRHWVRILERLVDEPQDPVGRMPLLDESVSAASGGMSRARTIFDAAPGLHEAFELQAVRRPDAIAVSCDEARLSFAELNARANRLARKLRSLGVGPDMLVGLCSGRSLEMVVGMLAILKAGGAYLPLDPDLPRDRLAYILADARPRVILTQSALAGSFTDGHHVVWCLDQPGEALLEFADTNVRVTIRGDNLAYCIYTSGSTGQPKGTLLTHRNAVRLFLAADRHFDLRERDVWTLFHSYAFDFSVWEVFGALLHGARVVIVPYLVSRSPLEFYQLLQRERVTVLSQTPSAFRQLMQIALNAPDAAGLALRYVAFGGEALDVASLKPWFERFGDAAPQLVNMYGITETTVHVTFRPMRSADLAATRSPIGEPLGDLDWHILDDALNPVPAGVKGELYIGGAGLARGYLGRPALTAQRFIPHPFAAGDGERLYKTGDRVLRRRDGSVEYVGRSDHQVKIRGFRIELGEIEAKLRDSADVGDVTVIVREDTPGQPRIVAYVVPARLDAADDTTAYAERLRYGLKQHLPDYMIPSAVVILERMPLTSNGKLDQRALPLPDFVVATSSYVAPQNALQATLAAIWADALKRERVGIDDNFFDIGGDSITAVQMTIRAKAEGITLSPRDLFRYQNIAALAEAATRNASCERREDASVALAETGEQNAPRHFMTLTQDQLAGINVSGDEIEDVYPLTSAQEGILFHSLVEPGQGTYIVQCSCRFDAELDTDALLAAWQRCIGQHPVLRTSIHWEGLSRAVQVVRREVALPVRMLDWQNRSVEEKTRDVESLIHDDYHTDFPFESAPLMRVTLVKLESAQWLFVWTHHHILMDAWSVDRLLEELFATYRALSAGQTPEIEEAAAYGSYVAWLERQDREAARDYWRQELGSLDSPSLLAHPVPAARRQQGTGRLDHRLSARLSASLRQLAQRERVTLNTLFQAATALTLRQYTGAKEVVFGVTTSGRNSAIAGIDRVKGLFINTLPLRTKVDGASEIGPWLRALQSKNVSMREYAFLPLQEIQACAGTPKATSLFDTIVVFENHPVEKPIEDIAAAAGISEIRSQHRNGYPLTMVVWPEDALRVLWIYDRQSFEAGYIEQYARDFLRTLALLAAPDTNRLGAVSPVTADEVRPMSVGAFAEDETMRFPGIAAAIEHRVRQQPERIAVDYAGQRVSYRELNERSNQLARKLRKIGIAPDVLVAVAMERSVDMVVALLAVLKAGGAWLPLDPDYPADRLAYMLADAKPVALLTHEPVLDRMPATDVPVWCFGRDSAELAAYEVADLPSAVLPDHLAYCIYTSGSTGRPKGVGNTHRALMNRLIWMQTEYGLQQDDCVLQKTPFSFDVSVWEFFWPLMVGARLAMAPAGAHRDPRELRSAINQHRVTTLHFVPSMLQAFVSSGELKDCPNIKRVMCSGEAMPVELEREFIAAHPAQLHNLYGPTEAAIDVTSWACRDGAGMDTVPIGRPVFNTATYVLDQNVNPVAPGVPGELYLGGVQLARGYLNRSSLTAERFVPDPFDAQGGRLYRTGDLVRWRADGVLEYLGRIDHQVKVRGLRIELGEVEAQLLSQAEVREAVVTAQQGPGGTRLVAYAVPHAGIELDGQALRARLGAALPDYMVPSVIVVLETMPLNPNGKLDRKALPSPQTDEDNYEAPVGEVEVALARTWSDVLGIGRVSRRANFFELGGDSILSLRIVSRMREAGWKVTPRQLFERQTILILAPVLRQLDDKQEGVDTSQFALVELSQAELDALALPHEQLEDVYPLSPMQSGMLFHSTYTPGGSAYLNQLRVDIDGLDVLRFRAAWQAATEHNAVLRTAFVAHAEGWLQWVAKHVDVPFEEHDWRAREDLARSLDDEAADQLARGFDLSQPPLQRLVLVRTGERQHHLIWTHHHVLMDGWSVSQLLGEVLRRYGGEAVSAQGSQYRDYIGWLQHRDPQQGEAYWRGELAQLDGATRLVGALPGGECDAQGQGEHVVKLDAASTARLAAFARAERVTVNTLVQAAWALVLRCYTGQQTVAFGATVAGRPAELAGSQQALGLFINTVPVITTVRADQQLGDWLRLLQAQSVAMREHEHTPLYEIQRWAGAGGQGLFDSVVVFENYPVDEVLKQAAPGGLRFSSLKSREESNYALTLLVVLGRTLDLRFNIDSQVLSDTAIKRLAEQVKAVLTGFAGHAERALGTWVLTGETQREALLTTARNAQTYDLQPVHAMFERRAHAHPDRIALVFGDEPVSYGELDARANRLAHRLVKLGIGPEVRVGIAAARSVELLVGLLAILKAGGAYVPLDPKYPVDRLSYMMADSRIGHLLTQSRLVDDLPAPPGAQVIELDTLDVSGEPDHAPEIVVDGEHLAYVIYTSGSTGQPKGVMVRHDALSNLLCGMQAEFRLGASDILVSVTSLSFDIAALELYLPLTVGARVVIASREVAADGQALSQLLDDTDATVMQATPSTWRMLSVGGWRGREIKGLCGGEALAQDLADTLRALGVDLWNMYGPTETTIWSSCQPVHDRPYLGKPISATGLYVLDTAMNLVPEGVAGELYIGGAGLARGYLNRPGLTAERFVPDPFDAHGARLYRTGDLVRHTGEGELAYLGRIDHQVKIRGHRIELGEVEARLLEQAAVREAVVTARPGPAGMRLVGYAVPHDDDAEIDVQTLRERLGAVLPDYMVPSALVLLDALPLTPNGKVDRKALPAPEVIGKDDEAPIGEAENALAGIWRQVLGVERASRHANFFELGGDSILSLQIVAQAREAGWKLTPRDLFERQTISLLAGVVTRIATPQREQREIIGEVPLLPIQSKFLATQVAQRHHWNQSVLLASGEPLVPELLDQALKAVIGNHGAFGLRFAQDGAGRWTQASTGRTEGDVLWVRRQVPTEQLVPLCNEAQRSLNLADGPLVRALAMELVDGSWRLLLAIHHLVVDGVSWRVLLEDLQTAYAQLRAGGTVKLQRGSTSYQAWARRLAGHARTESVRAQWPYWQRVLSAPAQLPCGNPAGAATRRHARNVKLTLDRATTQRLLQEAPAAYRTQVNDLLLTALGRALCSWTGAESVRIDLEGHGREDLFDDVDLSRSVGWFTSLFPVSLEPLGEPGQAIMRVKEMLRTVPDRGLGYGLLRHLGDEANCEALAHGGPSQVVFNYLGQFDQSFDERALWKPASEPAGDTMDDEAPLEHALSVNGQVYGGELSLTVTYSGERYEAHTIETLVQSFRSELVGLVDHCTSGATGVTPSDFSFAQLVQSDLDDLALPHEQLEDVYPLSPMQSGMLFHSTYTPGGSAYLNQLRVDIDGLDVLRFRAAWQAATEHNAVLRTAFVAHAEGWLQWVAKRVDVPFEEHDWQAREDLARALDDEAAEQLARGFDLSNPPLQRLMLVRTGERQHHLIWTHHHVLMDGWSVSQLLGEVLRRYGGEAVSTQGSQYRDYIGWLQHRDPQQGEAYWRGQLAQLDGATRLVGALPGGERDAQGQGEHVVKLDEASTARLAAFARAERVTVNTLVQAAWALVLRCYTGQQTVAFGATVAGRPAELAGSQHALGLFINTVPVITTVRADQQLGDWLRLLQAQSVAMREHEHTPLYEIQRWAGAGGQGLFDSVVVFENYPVDEVLKQAAPGGLHFDGLRLRDETNYPLTLAVTLGQSLTLKLSYARDVLDASVTPRLVEQVTSVLNDLVDAARQPVGELQLVNDASRAKLLARSRASMSCPCADTVQRRIAKQAVERPHATAVIFGDERLSYATLNARANRLAHVLIRKGVRPDVPVGIAVERSLETVVGLLAILKAGGAYVPLDPTYPSDRLRYMIEDSGIGLLLTHSAVSDTLPRLAGVEMLELDTLDVSAQPAIDPAIEVRPENLAYVIYTSGSTGRPKGAQITHRNVSRLLEATQAWFHFDESDVWTLFHSYAFDFSVWEIFGALCSGGQLVVVPFMVSRSPSDFLSLLRRERVTVLNQTPSAFRQLMQAPGLYQCGDLALRVVIFGGEALEPQMLRPWIEHFGDTKPQLVNMYGITETTVHVTYRPVVESDLCGQRIPVGERIPDLGVYVLDREGNLVPDGVAGEMYVSGAGLARGYLKRAALTAERFVPDPFGGHGGRLYSTGDLARWNRAGQLDYLGRIDHQVKVRGFRIELGEIEAQLLSQPGVREALVMTREGAGGLRLLAYVSARGGHRLDASALRAQLKRALPDHMVPDAVTVLDALPLNVNGKVDRRALPEPDLPQSVTEAYVEPRTETEAVLARIWKDVLQIERVGVHDRFFDLGGHSLLATRVAAEVRRQFIIELPLQLMFTAESLGDLAAYVDQQRQAGEADVKVEAADQLLDELEGDL
ncbi:non-ribosomal peptide synthetase [Paraburkholderia tropica]|uniref:non-ribosomal peptide synthetase n=1 Tax=Paraburkholderia tropica TaxID=92647 RepID=UPI0007EC836E|nr:non-ribosomal peptide synthetase [Paraburkholderia tropica]OBR47788.1 hypothetical protein A6456_35640 [Paraburkholderia tropica]